MESLVYLYHKNLWLIGLKTENNSVLEIFIITCKCGLSSHFHFVIDSLAIVASNLHGFFVIFTNLLAVGKILVWPFQTFFPEAHFKPCKNLSKPSPHPLKQSIDGNKDYHAFYIEEWANLVLVNCLRHLVYIIPFMFLVFTIF